MISALWRRPAKGGAPTRAAPVELRDSEERQRFALEAAGAGTWDWDLASGAMVWSDIAGRLYGIDLDGAPLSYNSWLKHIHGADRNMVDQALRAAVEQRLPSLQVEYRIHHPTMGERWILSLGQVRSGADGRPRRMLGVHLDVTERRRAGEALKVSEARFRVLFDMAPVGIIVLDPVDGAILAANARAQEMLGYSAEEFRSMRLADVEAWLDEERIRQSFDEIRTTSRTVQFETKHRRKDGTIVECLAAAHRVDLGEHTVIYKMWLDITGLKNTERQLALAKTEAERADAAKTQFLAAASHDLRQPVQSLFFFHSALAARLGGHPSAPLLDNMQASLDALKALLDGLLDISKLHAGTIDVSRTVFPLSALFARLEAEFAAHAHEKDLDFRVVPSSLWVNSDMALLERLLRNLLDNAIKYTRHGAILLGCRRQGDTVRLCVVDTGQGIPENRIEDVFHEFVQLGNPERDRSKGLGLGLAIVRHLAELLGHRLTVRSRLGHGTAFTLDLPAARAKSTRRRVRRERPALPAKRGLALVIDDEAMVLVALRALMEGMGWEVLAADSRDEAVRLVSGSRAPDVIVADYRLRNAETGVQVIRDVRGVSGVGIPAIVLTGDTSPDRMFEAKSTGIVLMHKPITPQAFETALAELQRQGVA